MVKNKESGIIMKKWLVILVLMLTIGVVNVPNLTPVAEAVPLNCDDDIMNDPECIISFLFQFIFSEWNEDNEGVGIHGVGIF